MNRMSSLEFSDRSSLDQTLATDVAMILTQAVSERGHATLVVSGGSTPINFFHALSQKALPWEKVSILLADERWVPPDDPASNERLVRKNLLINAARVANFIPFKTTDEQPENAEAALGRQLATMGMFDLVILGMGTDGHTASLFPGAATLDAALDMTSGAACKAVKPPHAPHSRMSMTLPRLLNSRQIFLHVTGDEKRAVLQQAMEDNDSARRPVAAVINQHETPVTLYFSR